MNWIIIAIAAHSLSAIVFIVDKYILSKTSLLPVAYAFYVGILGVAAFVLAPFGFYLLPLDQFLISLLAGALFVFAVLFFYKSIRLGEISRITPLIGGTVPIFTLFFTYVLLKGHLNFNQWIAFSFLVAGSFVVLWPGKFWIIEEWVKTPLFKRMILALLSALLFSASFIFTKMLFNYQPFINGFLWTRLGGVVGAVLLLLLPSARRDIFRSSRRLKFKVGSLMIANKGLSASAFLLLNYAIFLGKVSLVNALQGVQYAFLLVVAIFLSKKYPQIIKEEIGAESVTRKIIGIFLVGIGLGILAF